MRIFFVIVCLVKGHMGEDVSGITGGSIIINFQYPDKVKESVKSFCRVSDGECTDAQSQLWIPEERISVTEDKTLSYISVLIRNLTVDDSGTYEWKANSNRIQEVNLKVEQVPCCEISEEQIYLGGTAVIHCGYPETLKVSTLYQTLFKVQNGSLQDVIYYRGGDPRISLNTDDDHVFNVTITNVKKSDDGLYFCGAAKSGQQISYSILFQQIDLHVTEQTDASVNFDDYTIITVCVCLALLLAVGLSLLLLKRRCKKTEGSVSDQRNTRDDDQRGSAVYYATIQDSGNTHSNPSDGRPIGLNAVYATAQSPTNPSDFYTLAEHPQNTTQS